MSTNQADQNTAGQSQEEAKQSYLEWATQKMPFTGGQAGPNLEGKTNEEAKQSYMEWAKEKYGEKYEAWMPWIEDYFLKYFTKDNKASYATKQQLDQTKVTGIAQVDNLQDGVNNLVAGQVGQGGLLQPAGDLLSKEGINRTERQGKDDSGGYLPAGLSGGLPGLPGLSGQGQGQGQSKEGKDDSAGGGYLPSSLPGIPGLGK